MNSKIKTALGFSRQLSIVACGFFLLLIFFQCSLGNNKSTHNIVRIHGTNAQGEWSYTLTPYFNIVKDKGYSEGASPSERYQQLLSSMSTTSVGDSIQVDALVDESTSFVIQVSAPTTYIIRGKTYTLIEAAEEIAHLAGAASLEPAVQVTVKDVLDAHIPTPIRSKVSFPEWSYNDAFPESNDAAEFTITRFDQSPKLHKRTLLPKNNVDFLPSVRERLPRNPAVVKGPDGIGVYGGDWRQCAGSYTHLSKQIGGESFTRNDPSGKLQPNLAYKWDVSPDYKTFTFYMRKGHKWSDGSPFTVHDITWVLNEDIGSQRWSPAPDWMQETDGSKEFNLVDVKDWSILVEFLNGSNSIAEHIVTTAQTLKLNDFMAALKDKELTSTTRNILIQGLNLISGADSFSDVKLWNTIDLNSDITLLKKTHYSLLEKRSRRILENLLSRNDLLKRFANKDQEIKDSSIKAMNCMLIKTAFPTAFEQPYISRVIVEAVADTTGDDSHIIRFQFPQPNPLFLDRTATWMFYRGIFEMQRAFYAPYSYVGSDRLCTFDVYDWKAFTHQLHTVGQETTASAQKQLWSLLTENAQTAIAHYTGIPDDDGDLENNKTAEKTAIITAINTALQNRSFYQKSIWEKLQIAKRIEEHMPTAASNLSAPDWNRFREASLLKDLQQRVHDKGINSLSDHDVYLFNTMMYRFSYPAKSTVFAANREAALDNNARRHKNQYRTWVLRMRKLNQYNAITNPHTPTLSAWRIASSNLEVEIKAIRNPYYYKVDIQGNQLPYLDRIVLKLEKQASVRILTMTSGNVDFQTRDITTQDWSVLKGKEYAGGYRLRRWANDYCGELNLYTLQTNTEEGIGEIIGDKRFRYAISHALNRQELIDVIWQGIGTPSQRAVPEGSPFYNPKHNTFHIDYDLNKANALLDELGLEQRSSNGMRKLPNGKALVLNIYSSDASFESVVQMVCNYLQAVGINAQMKLVTRSAENRYLATGNLEIGANNGGDSYFGPLLPSNYAPSHPAENAQWHAWSSWCHSKGKGGIEPPQHFKDRKAQWDRVIYATDRDIMIKEWMILSEMTRVELPYIGITSSPGQVVYVKNGFKNVPALALSGWIAHQPANCCPEVFFKVKGIQ